MCEAVNKIKATTVVVFLFLSGSVSSDRVRLCWKCGRDKWRNFPVRSSLRRLFSLSTFSGRKTDRSSSTPGKHQKSASVESGDTDPKSSFMSCGCFPFQAQTTFRRNPDHRLADVWGLRCLHLYGLHLAAAGADAASAPSAEYV